MKKNLWSYILTHWQKSGFLVFAVAATFSLAFFIRFLNFFRTPNFDKVVVLFALFIFFFFLLLFFVQPILQGLFEDRKIMLMAGLAAMTIVTVLFLLLPYQNIPFRTTHHLVVSIPPESAPVVLERFSGPDGNPIPPEEVLPGRDFVDDDILLQPGDSLEYQREMTGQVGFQLTALDAPAQAVVQWDNDRQVIDLLPGLPVQVMLDPASWGAPSLPTRLFMVVVVFAEWLAAVSILLIILGYLLLTITKSGFTYRVLLPALKDYLVDYLILGGVLLSIAFARVYFSPNAQTYNLVLLTPGLIYLALKIIYSYVPTLPIVIIFLGILLNILARTPVANLRLLSVQPLVDRTFNELAIMVNPSESTLLSVGFFRQLRGAELVLSSESYFAEERNRERLIRINQLEAIHIEEFSGELSQDTAEQLLADEEWIQWKKRTPGAFYFYNTAIAPDSPIVFFSHNNDVFLVPIAFTDDLGLLDDFILD